MKTNESSTKPNGVPLPAIFGLDHDPSGSTAGNRFFFSTPLLSQRLSILKQLVGSQSMVIVVIGERGSGKTTLMNEFITVSGQQWRACRIKIKSARRKSSKNRQYLTDLSAFRSESENSPSIIIDDAHQLTASEMKKLLGSAFKEDGHRKFQSIVFFAEPAMRDRFSEIARCLPAKSVIDKIFMSPLTPKQTADYLRHRLRTAGRILQNPFTRDQLKEIHQRSGGLPGRVNGEAFMLLKKINRGRRPFKQSLTAKVMKWQKAIQWKAHHMTHHIFGGRKFGFHLK